MPPIVAHARYLAHHHDEVPAFHAAFLVTTFLVAALFPLGYFALMILGHMVLDLVKYREVHLYTWSETCAATFLESLVDLTLFFVSLTFAVYTHHTFFIVAMSSMLKSELTMVRAIGVLLPKMHIAEHALSLVLGFHEYLQEPVHGLRGTPLTRVQWTSALMLLLCIGSLALSPLLYRGHVSDLLQLFQSQLTLAL